jgi:oligoendopeptidase F
MPRLFRHLPAPPARRFLPKNVDCADVALLKRLHEQLLQRPLPTVASVRRWLDDVKETSVVYEEADAVAYIRKSINTRDRRAQAAFLRLVKEIRPLLAPYRDRLNRKLVEHPLCRRFPARWKLMLRTRRNAVELFRIENVPLQKQCEEGVLQYSRLMAGLEVVFEGRRQTLVQMARYQEEPDRSLRRRAFEVVAARRLRERSRVDAIYDRLIRLRARMARQAGFRNFRDFCHRQYARFDYTPADCFRFHEAVAEVVVPAVRRIRERRKREMGLAALKPWDLAVDPLGRPALHPFRTGSELARLVRDVLGHVNAGFGREFARLIDRGLLDLDNRPGKEPGGYQHTLAERQLPFIFMNAVGRDSDVRILLHEAGHAFHTLAMRREPILDYRQPPMEFCEVASMSMELLGNAHLERVFPEEANRERSTRALLEGIVEILPWIAIVDAFQHWVYTHPSHSRAERVAAWMRLRRRFNDGADWSGHRAFEEILWQRQGHLFGSPFYYIEYGIAQMGALMVWRQARRHPANAIRSYCRALALGGSVGLRELFRAIGGRLDFGPRTMRPLIEAVMERLDL